jgi:two-component sensor histidine kinase
MLQKENSERKRMEAEIYSIYNAISDLITVQDTNYRILSYNKTVENTFGKDLKGRLCYEVYQGRKDICLDCAVKKAIETKKLASTLQLSLNPPSAPSVEIFAYPIIDEKGAVTAVVEHGRDVSERIQMIETIKESEKQLKASVKEKEILLKEIHHRVKNNMAIVSSLLQLQTQYVKDESLNRIFSESRNRIASMALVHEKLYQSKDFIDINLEEYIQTLVDNLFGSYQTSKDAVRLKTDIDNIQMDIDKLIPCGLILNELITNSIKHAFQGREDGEIRINFKSTGSDKVTFSVSDNGCGPPEDLDLSNPKTLGLNLITSLTRQLRGALKYDGKEGMSVEITFNNP